MKTLTLTLFLFFSAGSLFAQISLTENGEVYTVVESNPEYPGGNQAMMKYINAELKYPKKSRRKKIEGAVFVQFTVEKDGTLDDLLVVKGINEEMDNEALRVVKGMPGWKPATSNKKPVKARFVLPIKYTIEEK
jgi:TonB family protein